MVTDHRPSIAELAELESEMVKAPWPTESEVLSPRFARLRNTMPVLLEIVAAALAFEPEMDYVLGPLSSRLRVALARVRP